MLDEVLEGLVRHARLVRPRGIAEDAGEAFRVAGLDGPEGIEQGAAHVLRGIAHVGPVPAVGNLEPVAGGGPGIVFVTGLFEGVLVFLVPDVGQPLEEQQRKDVLLVIAGINEPAQKRRPAPEVGFEFLLGEGVHGWPPSVALVSRPESLIVAPVSRPE